MLDVCKVCRNSNYVENFVFRRLFSFDFLSLLFIFAIENFVVKNGFFIQCEQGLLTFSFLRQGTEAKDEVSRRHRFAITSCMNVSSRAGQYSHELN